MCRWWAARTPPKLEDPTPAELLEEWLCSLEDKDWAATAEQLGVDLYEEQDGPLMTGDPEIDAIEREIWAKELARRAEAAQASLQPED